MNTEKKKRIAIQVIFVLLLLSPIIFYASVFKIGVWNTHDDWAKMGTALGGIYAPILSLLTIVLLSKQVELQNETRERELRLTLITDIKRKAHDSIEKLDGLLQHKFGSKSDKDLLLESLYTNDSKQIEIFWMTHAELESRFIWAFTQLDTLSKLSDSHTDYLLAYQDLSFEMYSRWGNNFLHIIETRGLQRRFSGEKHFL